MLARVAETLYWTARDLERAENFARLLEVGQAAALEGDSSNGAGGRLVWEPLVRIAGDYESFLLTHRRADERSVPWFLTFGRDNPDSSPLTSAISTGTPAATNSSDTIQASAPPAMMSCIGAFSLRKRRARRISAARLRRMTSGMRPRTTGTRAAAS